MKIRKEGDKGKALYQGKLVEVVYRRQWFHYKPENVDVFSIFGVYEPTGEVLVIPPQATPDIAAAIKAKEAKESASDKDTAPHQPSAVVSVGR